MAKVNPPKVFIWHNVKKYFKTAKDKKVHNAEAYSSWMEMSGIHSSEAGMIRLEIPQNSDGSHVRNSLNQL